MKLISRKEAKALGLMHYCTGIPCKRGHVAKRTTRGKACVECSYLTSKAWSEQNRDRCRARQKAYHLRHIERVRARQRRFKGLPEPTRPCPAACESCGRMQRHALHLDHCHETGKFRGWLCGNCNRGIGYLGDNVASVMRVVDYLRRSA